MDKVNLLYSKEILETTNQRRSHKYCDTSIAYTDTDFMHDSKANGRHVLIQEKYRLVTLLCTVKGYIIISV